MLDFYGLVLVDEATGELARNNTEVDVKMKDGSTQKAPHWKWRYYNIKYHPHNNLRLSRIIQAHQLLGFPQFVSPLVELLIYEVLGSGELRTEEAENSVPFWIKYVGNA